MTFSKIFELIDRIYITISRSLSDQRYFSHSVKGIYYWETTIFGITIMVRHTDHVFTKPLKKRLRSDRSRYLKLSVGRLLIYNFPK